MGHRVLGHQAQQALHGRCDSFVVETTVHYSSDVNLLFDAIGKAIKLTGTPLFGCWHHHLTKK